MSDRTSTATVDRDAIIAQQTSEAGLALAKLAKLNLPPVYSWSITWSWDLEAVLLEGMLAIPVDLDAALNAWGEVLETAQRQVKAWRNDPSKGQASVIGVYDGVMVRIWDQVDMPGGAA